MEIGNGYSRLGIISFVLSATGCVFNVISKFKYIPESFLFLLMIFVGFCFGVASTRQTEKKKLFGIIGIIFSLPTIILTFMSLHQALFFAMVVFLKLIVF